MPTKNKIIEINEFLDNLILFEGFNHRDAYDRALEKFPGCGEIIANLIQFDDVEQTIREYAEDYDPEE